MQIIIISNILSPDFCGGKQRGDLCDVVSPEEGSEDPHPLPLLGCL